MKHLAQKLNRLANSFDQLKIQPGEKPVMTWYDVDIYKRDEKFRVTQNNVGLSGELFNSIEEAKKYIEEEFPG